MESKQVLSIEQMQHLQELGLKLKDAMMYWSKPHEGVICRCGNDWFLSLADDKTRKFFDVIPAYTLQDVLDALPKEIKPNTIRYWLRIDLVDECIYYFYDDYNLTECRKKVFSYDGKDSLIDAAYKMLCWCIENGHVKTNKSK